MATILKTNRKYAEIRENAINNISLSLATREDVLEWSHGEVEKPETINYKTFKPEKSGLFDEIIFGPITDYKCPVCGTKYKRTNEGQICEKTDECKLRQPEILPRSAKRSRMGHIELASPVVHFWFFKVDHSIIAKLLGLRVGNRAKMHSRSVIEDIIYFKSHIILESGDIKALAKNEVIHINTAAITYRDALLEIREKFQKGSSEYEDITFTVEDLEETASSKIGKDYGIDFYELNNVIEAYSKAKIGTGAKAIEYLLDNLDIKVEARKVRRSIDKINALLSSEARIPATKMQDRNKLYKRLKVLESFISSKQDPKSMLIYNLPVIPADLRPLVQLDGGRHSTTDVNELYRRIIIRNNRLRKWFDLDAPVLIIQNEMRMLQESVDALIDNSRRKPNPVQSKDNRPLKSIADALTGKKGRFRQNLLGKRVDYSGRSVIVVGPNLKMHQAGIPRQMAAKLFEPWIVRELIEKEIASSIKVAKKMIEEQNPLIWPHVEKSIEGKPILLNRAPTLHRLSIQAFEPVLIRGKAIRLHPLVTTAFNADFDGDQMAVHVPISKVAMMEAKELMYANKNILGPKDGEPIINPSQDMVLGIFYLTKEIKGAKGEGKYFASYKEMMKAYDNEELAVNSRVAISTDGYKKTNFLNIDGYVISTVGKFIFNKAFPIDFPFIFNNSLKTLDKTPKQFIAPRGSNLFQFINDLPMQEPLIKKEVAIIIRKVFDEYVSTVSKEDIANIVDQVNESNYEETTMLFSKLIDYKEDAITSTHAKTLSRFVKKGFAEINKKITIENEGVTPIFGINEKVELLEYVWFNYTNIIANALDKIKELGFKFSMLSGTTVSVSDIITSKIKKEKVIEGDIYIEKLFKMFKDGLITDDERYSLVLKKWTAIKNVIQEDLKGLVKDNPDNPVFMMMRSGARGNISNFVQLAGMRGLMANNAKVLKAFAQNDQLVRSTVEVPVKSSFLEGLTSYEFYSSTHGARKGLTDIALNTAKSGYLTRRLVDMSQNIVVREKDCGADFGYTAKNIMDTKTKTTIVLMIERITGRFANKTVFNKNGEVIVKRGKLITAEKAKKIKAAGIERVEIRSILGCQTRGGVCKKCYGVDLATNRVVNIGEAVGIIAAQSIGEPGTQLTMRTFHTGGVAGVDDITGGFARLIELIDAYDKPWGRPAIISLSHGEVIKIETITLGKNLDIEQRKITVSTHVHEDHEEKEYTYTFDISRKLRVKKGDIIVPGQKIVEGPIILKELLKITDARTVQNYLLKEIQRIYRMQGISISDKYIEIVIRQMLSKLIVSDPGDSRFYAGELIDIFDYEDANANLFAKKKKPAFGTIIIKGAKQIPLLSNSFLAAASYQETAKILVHASIASQVDYLVGLKENIVVGHKIPAGTGTNFEPKSKFDIKDSALYFK